MSSSDLCYVRSGGAPIADPELFNSDAVHGFAENVCQAKDHVRELGVALADALYEIVPRCQVKSVRRALLQVRRDAFATRGVQPGEEASAWLDGTSPQVAKAVRDYQRALDQVRVLEDSLERALEEEEERERSLLVALARTDRLSHGLVLASPQLAAAVDSWSGHRAVRANPKLESAVLKYYTRMTRKATPFGLFCSIIPGKFVNHDTEPVRILGSLSTLARHTQTDLRARHLARMLLEEDSPGTDAFPVAVNETLTQDGDRYHLLAVHDSGETFRSITKAPGIDEVLELLSTDQASIDHLLTRFGRLGASPQEVREFLHKLCEMGILVRRSPVREGNHGWIGGLLHSLRGRTDRPAALAKSTLRSMDRFREQMTAAATGKEARVVMERAQRVFARLGRESTGETEIVASNVTPLPQDCSARARVLLSRDLVFPALRDVKRFARLTYPIAHPRAEQCILRSFYEATFSGAASVPLLRFYEAFQRSFLDRCDDAARHSWLKAPREVLDPLRTDLFDSLLAARKAVNDLVKEVHRRSASDEVAILSMQDFEQAVAPAPNEPWFPASPLRITAFAEWLGTTEARVARLFWKAARYTVGWGRYFSRFLHLLPGSFTQEIRRAIRNTTGGTLAEIDLDSGYNVNLHPALTRRALRYPGTTGRPQSIDLRDLRVMPGAVPGVLELRTRSGERIVPLDTGFLNPRLRPPLFRFLIRFCFHGFGLSRALRPDPGLPRSDGEIGRLPRVQLGDHLVVSRQRWFCPTAAIPTRRPGEIASHYARRLCEWHAVSGLPRQVYVHMAHASDSMEPAPGDDHKPQYLNFTSPGYIALLGRLSSSSYDLCVFEECLPKARDLMKAGSSSYATECVFDLSMAKESSA